MRSNWQKSHLDDNWRFQDFRSLQDCIDGRGWGAVEGRQSDVVFAAVSHQLQEVVAGDDAGRNDAIQSGHFERNESRRPKMGKKMCL